MTSSRTGFFLLLSLAMLPVSVVACSETATEPETRETTEKSPGVLAAGAGAGSPEAAARAAPRRAMKISARVSPMGEVLPPPAPCVQFFETSIEGNATHLGRLEGAGSTCVTGAAPDPAPPFLPPGPAPYLTATFFAPLWSLQAANGDELHLEGSPSVCVFSLADGSLRCEGSLTIIGGTGRFDGATGELEVGSINEDGIPPDDFWGDGWIRF